MRNVFFNLDLDWYLLRTFSGSLLSKNSPTRNCSIGVHMVIKTKFGMEIVPFLYAYEISELSVLFPLHLIGGREDKVVRLNAKVAATLSRATDSKKFTKEFACFQ